MSGRPNPGPVARWPGVEMLSPITTGPTGTYGGANVGIGPFPKTFITCALAFQTAKLAANQFAKSVISRSAAGSFAASPSSFWSRAANVEGLNTSSAGESREATGVGMFGMGGAIGPGNAANAGYQGRPGTVTLSAHCFQAPPTARANPVAMVEGMPVRRL